jgi:hypothetical protein
MANKRPQVLALTWRHAGGRFTQQEHFRPKRKRDGDIKDALVSVRQMAGVHSDLTRIRRIE